MVDVKLTALLAQTAFAQDENLFTLTERANNNGPLLERDVGTHAHDGIL